MRISDWSSDVCSSDLTFAAVGAETIGGGGQRFEAAVGMRIEQRAQDLRFPGLLRGGVGGLEQVVDRGVRRAHGYVAGAGEDRGRVDPRQVDDVLVLRDRKSTRLNSSH